MKVFQRRGSCMLVYENDARPVEIDQLFQLQGKFLVHLVDVQGGGDDPGHLIHQL